MKILNLEQIQACLEVDEAVERIVDTWRDLT